MLIPASIVSQPTHNIRRPSCCSNGITQQLQRRRRRAVFRSTTSGSTTTTSSSGNTGSSENAVAGVIFDVDGVLCSSEHLSRQSAAAVMRQLYGLAVAPEEFIPFGGQGEARFLGGVAEKYGVAGFDVEAATALFFDVYINTYTKGPAAREIGFPGALELVRACRAAGLATAVASSAERVKVGRAAAGGWMASRCLVWGCR
jgi:hypothetical protein